jgi:2-polyprenyl-3-methyl-5-hydroxy-6-metoxy-1,4-benzoquinol methylase
MMMKMKKAQEQPESNAAWYDEHYYQGVQFAPGPWHKALIPDLIKECDREKKIVELGCGQAQVPRMLVQMGKLAAGNTYGIDQSQEAIKFVNQHLPGAHFSVQDLNTLNFPDSFFDICIMLETIEHLEHPETVLRNVFKILKPGGTFYLSFPNFAHLPWLVVRLLSQALNKPSWICLQPVDKIYSVYGIRKLTRRAGFAFVKGIGSNYGPPVFYLFEKEWMTKFLNNCGMYWWSFHPVLKFIKPLK